MSAGGQVYNEDFKIPDRLVGLGKFWFIIFKYL